MKYTFDHDYHIHSYLSTCSSDPDQNTKNILEYAKREKLTSICITDHLWDSAVPGAWDWYKPQNIEHISQNKPLPQADGIKFLFGCETELDKNMTVALAKENFDLFDFIVIPTTHMHMEGGTVTQDDIANPTQRGVTWLRRLNGVLEKDLPFHKIGLAHLTTTLIATKPKYGPTAYLESLDSVSDKDMEDAFKQAAKLGVGIELNEDDFEKKTAEELKHICRPYQIAKEQGCKFYLGSDAHHLKIFKIAREVFETAIDLLNLEESDKFHIGK